MAAQDLSASALTFVQAKLDAILAADQSTPSKFWMKDHIGTAKGLFSEHRARTSPITDALGNCVGYRVYTLDANDETLDYDGDGDDDTTACDILSGDGAVSSEKIYSLNTLKIKNFYVDDDICGDLFKNPGSSASQEIADVVAHNLASAMHALRAGLNASSISLLEANKSAVNNDSSLPDGVAFGSSEFTVTESTLPMNDPDTLTDIEAIAANNDMDDFFLVAGRYHFYNAKRNAQYHQLNDNERDVIRWMDQSIYFDIKNLDSTLSGKNSFAVDPGSYILFDHIDSRVTMQPTLVSPKDNLYEYFIEDPMLLIRQNGVLRPIRYHVAYQFDCNGVNRSRRVRTFTHKWEITFNGGFHVAPPATDGHTGILKFVSASE